MKQEVKVIPTIYARTKKEFDERFNKIVPIADEIQIDFMDRKFVFEKSIKLSDVPNLRNYENKFEAHLMVSNPLKWVKRVANKGFQKVIFHYKAIIDEKEILHIINEIHKLDMEAFIAINPEIREDEIYSLLDNLDGVLIMGVSPGKEKQKLLHKTYYKIANLRQENKKIPIQVDGGVNLYTAPQLVEEGATILNSGSFIARSKHSKEVYEDLVKAANK